MSFWHDHMERDRFPRPFHSNNVDKGNLQLRLPNPLLDPAALGGRGKGGWWVGGSQCRGPHVGFSGTMVLLLSVDLVDVPIAEIRVILGSWTQTRSDAGV